MALILAVTVGLVGLMFGTGHRTPRLGIDLAGGTEITLTATSKDKAAVNQANMNIAVGIIQKRVNAFGVSEAEVQTQGNDNIIVDIPKGTNSQQAAQQVGTTAQLYFRPVLAVAPSGAVTPTPSSSPSAAASGSSSPSAPASGSPSAASGSPSAAASGSTAPSASASASKAGRALSEGLLADASGTPSAAAAGSAAAPS
ncbi:protein translocase subunit SecD, partial [Kitasatospora sp. LaBMicrA B282]